MSWNAGFMTLQTHNGGDRTKKIGREIDDVTIDHFNGRVVLSISRVRVFVRLCIISPHCSFS